MGTALLPGGLGGALSSFPSLPGLFSLFSGFLSLPYSWQDSLAEGEPGPPCLPALSVHQMGVAGH